MYILTVTADGAVPVLYRLAEATLATTPPTCRPGTTWSPSPAAPTSSTSQTAAISQLNDRLAGPRRQIKQESAVHQAAAAAIAGCCAERWVSCQVRPHTSEHFRQAGAGRPGPATTCKKVTASH